MQAIPGVLWQETLPIVRQTGIQIKPLDVASYSKGLKFLIQRPHGLDGGAALRARAFNRCLHHDRDFVFLQRIDNQNVLLKGLLNRNSS